MCTQNFVHRIGEVAGMVWHYLADNGHATTMELKSHFLLTNKELYAATGWLLREEKIITTVTDTGLILRLK